MLRKLRLRQKNGFLIKKKCKKSVWNNKSCQLFTIIIIIIIIIIICDWIYTCKLVKFILVMLVTHL